MSDTCIIKQFGGCDCAPGECRSYSATIARKQADRDRKAALRTIQAKQNAYRVMLVAFTVASLCAFAGASWNTLKNMERNYQLEARV